MRGIVFVAAFLLLDAINSHSIRERGLHEPSTKVPTFLRDSVERMPTWEDVIYRSMPYTESFGSRSLPLRSAVESVPDAIASTRRLPLRDSVESRPLPYDVVLGSDEYEVDLDFTQTSFTRKPEKVVWHPTQVKEAFENVVRSAYSSPIYRIDNMHQTLVQPSWSYQYRTSRKNKFGGSLRGDKKLVCYVQAASRHRKEPLSFVMGHLDPFACTHVIYAFANIDPHSFTLAGYDDYGYKSLTRLKHQNHALKVLLAIGGPRGTNANRSFGHIVSSAQRRRAFIMSVIKTLKEYQLDGVDLHWLHPGDEQFDGHASDKDSYLTLLEELSEIFRKHNWILSISVPASRFGIEEGFVPEKLNILVDFVNVQAYDFHEERGPVADHHSPLKVRPRDEDLDRYNNVDYAVKFWLKRGLARDKIVLGLPFYGRSFTLKPHSGTGIGAAIEGPGTPGYYTQQPGLLSYFEICDSLLNVDQEWTMAMDGIGSPYITNGDQWIGYDNVESIAKKMEYIKDMELGGGFVWSVDMDDFKGLCGESWPLLRAIKQSFSGDNIQSYELEELPTKPYGTCNSDGLYSDRRDCSLYFVCRSGLSYHLACGSGLMFNPENGRCEYIAASSCRPGRTFHIQNTFRPLDDILRYDGVLDNRPRVVCYMSSWAFHRKGDAKFVPENLDTQLCSHVVYAFASLNPENLQIKEFDPWVDLDNNLYERVTGLHDVKVLLSLGGWTDSSGDKYSRLVSDGSARRKFIVGVVSFLRRHNFAGLQLDWNYPVCWQSNCNKGAANDRPNFSKLIQELKREFDKQSPPLILAAAISGYKEVIDVAYDLRTLGAELEFMSVMTYDYHGSWEMVTGHVSPLNPRRNEMYPQYSSAFIMEYLVQQGAPKDKLVMSVPFYGQSFTLSETDLNGIGSPAVGPGEPGEFTKQPGMLAYYEICNRIENQRWHSMKDISGPYAFNENQWVGYDSVESAQMKAQFVKTRGYGGIVAWTVDLDDFNNKCCQGTFPLLRAINRGLGISNDIPIHDCTRPNPPVTPVAPSITTGIDSGATDGTTPSTSTVWWVPESTTTEKRSTTTQGTTTTTNPPLLTTVPPLAVLMPEKEPEVPTKCPAGFYKPDPTNCNAYYRCILGELRKEYCVVGLHWNRRRNNCDWPADAKCEEVQSNFGSQSSEIPQRSTTRPTTTAIAHPVYPSSIESLETCTDGQHYAHHECNSFYVCSNGQLISQQCAPGLQWNADKKMCDWGYKVKCINRRWQARVESEKFVKLQDDLYSLPGEACDSGNFAGYQGDCSSYLICIWGKYETFRCSNDLHWNRFRKTCDWPASAKCTAGLGGVVPEQSGEETTPPHQPADKTTLKPPATTELRPEEPLEPNSGYFKIVCYFTNWAWYRQGEGKYLPEDIDANLCTHIVYGFAVLDYSELIIKAHDSWADFDNKFYERVVAYKKKGLKVTIAIGGWNDSQGDKYSRLVNNPSARAKFIKNVIEFIEKHNFDGLDLDWEYPKCWQVDCKRGPDSDKAAFAAFVRELRVAFQPRGLLLSAAVSPSKTVIDAGYDVKALADNLDWVAVMTYDYHGQWDKQTGHVAPMYVHEEDEVKFFNSNYTINYWITEGIPSRKIVMGMPLYGQSFRLENRNNHGLNAKASGPGEAGEFTRAAGFLAYYEICERIQRRGWNVVRNGEHRMGPYAYYDEQWVSFDDKEMIQFKSQYIRSMNLGGGMVWALDLDDFRNRCGEGKHPLLSTIRRVLAAPLQQNEIFIEPESHSDREPIEVHQEVDEVEIPEVEQKPSIPHAGTSFSVDRNSEYKVVCYFTNWAWYRQGNGKYTPSDIDPDLCTHIVYGFAVLDGDQGTIKPHDTWADFDNKFYEKVTAYRAKGIKVLIAIGGWNDSAGDKYSRLVNNPSARRTFISHVVNFIETHGFDGLDLDWEYPKCWQVDCNKGPDSDKAAFAAWVRELAEAFKPKGWLLSAAVSPSRRVIDAGYDVPTLTQYLDWIAVMCYDYHGQWDKVTGHVAPMYAHPEDADVTFNANQTIHYWIHQGANPKKLVMGMPMYGQSFSLADNSDHGLNAPTYGGGEAGDQTRARGFLSYYEICQNIKQKGWNVVRDPKMRIGPYAYLRDQWVSFDDREMIRHKAQFIKNMGLGGGMIWALDLDDFRDLCNCETHPLLKTINRVLRGYSKPEPACTLEDPNQPTEASMVTTRRPTQAVTWWSQESTTHSSWTQATEGAIITPEKPVGAQRGCRGNQFEAHEDDCNAYYMCIHNKLHLQRCPASLHWSNGYCDWPAKANCQQEFSNNIPGSPEANSAESIEPITVKPPHKSTMPSYKHTTRPNVRDDGKKVVCYFTNWAWYRPGDGKFVPEDIDAALCTHITYGFAVLDPNTLTITPHDSWADIDNKFFTRVVEYQKKGIKVLIALGGWNDSQGSKYSTLVNSAETRARFIQTITEFIEQWGFDGLDLDWEYPKCWQVNCDAGPDSDKPAFAQFVSELRQAFTPRGWLLSAAVSPSKAVIDAGYEVASLSENFDWIAVMCYDYHGQWDKKTGHVAPLYYYPGDDYDSFNVNYTIHYWMEKGADPNKLIMGMPLYGQSFALADPNEHGINAKADGPGDAGEFTRAAGFLAFYEICDKTRNNNWDVVRDPEGRIGPYAYKGNQWVSYDDIADIRRKSQLVKDWGLGGGMVWALDLDDFRNRCGCGASPLLRNLNNVLRDVPLDIQIENCT